MTLGFVLSACSSLARETPTPKNGPDPQNGERIYFTSMSNRGDQTIYSGGPNFGGMMMGSYLTCAACHGPEGRGGLHQMHMTTMNAPDIRYSALNSMPDMQNSKTPYGMDQFKLEVEEGKDLNGEELNSDMPRWSMSNDDLEDLFAFLKTLP
jgi:hypothetical protein